MRDETYDRDYQAGRQALNDSIGRLASSAYEPFRRLAAIQYDAPWQRKAARRPLAAPRVAVRHIVLLTLGVALGSGASLATALAPFGLF